MLKVEGENKSLSNALLSELDFFFSTRSYKEMQEKGKWTFKEVMEKNHTDKNDKQYIIGPSESELSKYRGGMFIPRRKMGLAGAS